VVGAVRTITGADAPEAALVVIRDPQVAAQLRVQLAEFASEREKAERQAERDELLARLAGAASARSQTMALAQAGSRIACPDQLGIRRGTQFCRHSVELRRCLIGRHREARGVGHGFVLRVLRDRASRQPWRRPGGAAMLPRRAHRIR
jgi:hypothetical protein